MVTKETQKRVDAERRKGKTPLPPEICSEIRKYMQEEFGFTRYTMHLVDDGGSRDYTHYGVGSLSRKVNAAEHLDVAVEAMRNMKGVDEDE